MRSLLGCGLALLVALDVPTTATQTPPLRFVAVTAGADHVCALTDRGGRTAGDRMNSASSETGPQTQSRIRWPFECAPR
jgi:hypothetical protein